jgi:23S rRNA (adenine2503-C2)-methyltransferase
VNHQINILSLTSASYATAIQNRLGKGYQHALLIYEEWFRTGQVLGKNPAFNNAKILLQDILAVTNFTYLSLLTQKDDGFTGKFLLSTPDHLEIESVLIPMQAGGTLCVSSQVGCRMGCAFCETGKMGLLRSLTVDEITSQLFVARFHLNFEVRNVVFMGMGEPFDNYDAVMEAFRILTDPHGFGLGRNHITISTSGCVDGIYRLLEEKGEIPNLAVSLNAPNDELRQKLMPINKKYPLAELYKGMHDFCHQTNNSILVAYVLMKGQNDTPEHAEHLAQFLQGLDVKINLIPYNPQTRDRFQPSDDEVIDSFASQLRTRGYQTLIRRTKGQKIMAACGQLGNLKLRKEKYSSLSRLPTVDL